MPELSDTMAEEPLKLDLQGEAKAAIHEIAALLGKGPSRSPFRKGTQRIVPTEEAFARTLGTELDILQAVLNKGARLTVAVPRFGITAFGKAIFGRIRYSVNLNL
jgi:hypothetical protein